MRASAAATFYYPGVVFSALQAHDTSVLSANAIRSSLNFISDLFGRFLYALAWKEKYRYAQRHRLRGVSAVAAAEFFDAVIEAHQRDAERDIRRLIGWSDGPLSDEFERRITEHLMRNSSFRAL
jgi:cytoplasmic iron level regulating protein YaaA (DUF328/UPF0246 family)